MDMSMIILCIVAFTVTYYQVPITTKLSRPRMGIFVSTERIKLVYIYVDNGKNHSVYIPLDTRWTPSGQPVDSISH